MTLKYRTGVGVRADLKLRRGFLALPFIAMLAACGGDGAEVDMSSLTPEQQEVKQLIDARQANFQDMGAAFKAIGDELKAGRPDSTTVKFSVDSVVRYAAQIGSWFPEGTGPASGFKTETKAAVWENPEEFEQVLSEFEAAVSGLAEANANNDAQAIAAQFQIVGGGCKSCHDKFREED
ncbi:c-type cytochrome [Hyphomonas beringensis]|uniref:c-type cytochrome n=1 Tax=Hyphomonas beringensis TaxID=1280946 RepID=UPI00138E54C6|nr:cytochrome c [Hyphomonas beringensis]